MKFLLPNKHEIVFTGDVLSHFERHRQLNASDTEAGGQLFAEFQNGQSLIRKATGPRFFDLRGRFFYRPKRMLENIEILKMRKDNFHYIGDWHTHPEQIPRPSAQDIKTISSYYKQSEHHLLGFVMVIVGTNTFPSGLSVSFHDDRAWVNLKLVT